MASGGCPCGDVAQKAEVDSLRERLAHRDASIDHLSGLLQMVGERMVGRLVGVDGCASIGLQGASEW